MTFSWSVTWVEAWNEIFDEKYMYNFIKFSRPGFCYRISILLRLQYSSTFLQIFQAPYYNIYGVWKGVISFLTGVREPRTKLNSARSECQRNQLDKHFTKFWKVQINSLPLPNKYFLTSMKPIPEPLKVHLYFFQIPSTFKAFNLQL